MKRLGDESGQALIIAALCMTCLLGFVALATDVGVMLHEKRLLQTAADSAAIAAAAELRYGDYTAAAVAAATQNGVTDGQNGATVSVNGTNGPVVGPHAGNSNYVEVIASQVQPTVFMRLFNRSSMTVTARAVATSGQTNGCIYTLGTSGVDLGLTGNSSLSIATCGIVIDSSSSSALNLTGNITLDAQSIGIVGGYSANGNVNTTPTPVTGMIPISDPLGFLPTPVASSGCSPAINLTGNNTQTISSGCYAGISASGNSALTLGSGNYVINGPFSITGNASITGSSVTLGLLGSTTLTGNISLNLTAPTTGPYDGVLIDQPASNTNDITITGNSGATLKGIIYAPSSDITMNGNSGSNIYTDFVVKSLNLVGNSSFQDYASINSSSVLSSAQLVE